MEMAVKNPFVSTFLNTIIDDYDCIFIIYGTQSAISDKKYE